jgi:hypothetical protein
MRCGNHFPLSKHPHAREFYYGRNDAHLYVPFIIHHDFSNNYIYHPKNPVVYRQSLRPEAPEYKHIDMTQFQSSNDSVFFNENDIVPLENDESYNQQQSSTTTTFNLSYIVSKSVDLSNHIDNTLNENTSSYDDLLESNVDPDDAINIDSFDDLFIQI